jgi:hypothetical protein
MEYKFAKPSPKKANWYMTRTLSKNGIERELFGKPLLIIGDDAISPTNSEDKNISGHIDYPTFSLVDHILPEALVGVGKYEFTGNVSRNGSRISFCEISRGTPDIFSEEYTDFVEKNPALSTICEIQRSSEYNTFPFQIAKMNDRELEKNFGTRNKQLLYRFRKSALDLRYGDINSLFDGVIINGNAEGTEEQVFEIIDIFKHATIPVRFINSTICPVSDIYKQKSTLIAQRIFDAIKEGSEARYTPYNSKLGSGRCRAISLVTKKACKK